MQFFPLFEFWRQNKHIWVLFWGLSTFRHKFTTFDPWMASLRWTVFDVKHVFSTHESKIGREEKFRYICSFWAGLVHCTTNKQHDHFITHCSICHYDTATLRMPISSIATTNSPLRKYDFIAIDFFFSLRKVNFLTLTQQCLRRACSFPGLNRITGLTVWIIFVEN